MRINESRTGCGRTSARFAFLVCGLLIRPAAASMFTASAPGCFQSSSTTTVSCQSAGGSAYGGASAGWFGAPEAAGLFATAYADVVGGSDESVSADAVFDAWVTVAGRFGFGYMGLDPGFQEDGEGVASLDLQYLGFPDFRLFEFGVPFQLYGSVSATAYGVEECIPLCTLSGASGYVAVDIRLYDSDNNPLVFTRTGDTLVVAAAVPEPSTAVLVTGILFFFARRRFCR